MTKCLAACLRYKSRRVANCFWKWKFGGAQAQILPAVDGRSTIHGATVQTGLDADSEVADLIQKYKLFNQEVDAMASQDKIMTEENIDDDDEVAISKNKKQEFDQPVQYAGPENREYDLNVDEVVNQDQIKKIDPTKKPDDGTPKPQIFYQILNSKNKDFGNILRTSNSVTSVQSYEEIGGNKETNHQKNIDINQLTEIVLARSRAAKVAEKFLALQLRRLIRHWRQDTDQYLADVKFRMRCSRMQLQRQKVIKLMAIKVNNEKAMLR